MRTKILKLNVILFVLAVFAAGCNTNKTNDALDDNLIANNLLEKGKVDQSLLIGEWELIKFAFTTNGKKIIDIAEKPYPYCRFSISDYVNEFGIPTWGVSCLTPFRVEYLISPPNLIKLSLYQTAYVLIDSPEMDAIVANLNNAYSFVINDDELIIHFKEINGKNLLIFKKQ